MVFEIPLNRRTLLVAVGLLILTVLLFVFAQGIPHYVPKERIWAVVEKESERHGLDPEFVFALVIAESSGNARARTSVARGLMQITEGTWGDTTDVPYARAFDWPTNVAVGAQHLADLRARLEERESFSYPRLAAAYRHGFGALLQRDLDVSRFPPPRNRIYRELFAGNIPDPARWLEG